ncbi:hypothetical protein Rhopal_003502-T1 [Rhodotorula paludigena]|uniref:Methyltransferase type 11 domain-containing protein n=1 Tax=Rhodotorula paludigena TaxID=86838 RepID=A0AAV5GLV6_9BASI|nr:hypothetical protein Rhopal_003502-T1 [Rhodotorula paludigena]
MAEHQLFATTNFSKSGSSGLYDRARPNYPDEAHAQILSLLAPNSKSRVVELGAGTGLFTRGFVAAAQSAEHSGRVGSVLAVEPSEGMREGFENKLKDVEQGEIDVKIVDGTFERIPVEDASADLAFHWTGHNPLPAAKEVARVLKPGGAWALIWNLEDRNVQWVAQLRDHFEQFEADTPQYRHGYWKVLYQEAEYDQLFTAPEHTAFRRSLPTNEDLVVDRVFSKSYITALSDEQRKELEIKLRDTVRRGDGKKWIDEKEGVFAYPYETDLFIARRKD